MRILRKLKAATQAARQSYRVRFFELIFFERARPSSVSEGDYTTVSKGDAASETHFKIEAINAVFLP